jgi:hypothetical protein
MKTTEQIEAVLNEWWETEPFGFDHPETKSGILNLMNTMYTQAQNDMLAEAMEGLEEWISSLSVEDISKLKSNANAGIDNPESPLTVVWQAARLSMMKSNKEPT